jgi:hypothetical protein
MATLSLLRSAPALVSLQLLTGCGGTGFTGSVASTPVAVVITPSPTPTPAAAAVPPFPSSSPPTAYTARHASVTANVSLQQLAGGQARVTSLNGITFGPTSGLGNISYEGPNSYSVEFGGFGGPAFRPADLAASTAAFDVFRTEPYPGYPSSIANLEIARKDAGVNLTYTTFGNVIETQDQIGRAQITYFVAGSSTPAARMPTTGTARFSGIADGLWIDGTTTRRLYGSIATLTANFATGGIISTLDLFGHADPFGEFLSAPTTPLGNFTGSGTISGATFQGVYGQVIGYSGAFAGDFNGPAANEFGLSFTLTGQPGQSAFGVAVGKGN